MSHLFNSLDKNHEEQDTSFAPPISSLFPFITIDLSHGTCWEWQGSVSSAGLPHRSSAHHITSVSLKRLFWLLLRGPLRGGLHPNLSDRSCELVASNCFNKRCLRPSHLIAIPATACKPEPRETYQGIGPRKVRPLTPLSIQRRTRAERLLRLKREGYTNKAAAKAVGMSIKNAEKIIGGKVFPSLNCHRPLPQTEKRVLENNNRNEGKQCRSIALGLGSKSRLP